MSSSSTHHDIPTTINGSGGPHHHQYNRSTVSNMTTISDFPDVLGNDELAANLIKCATYVKLGETHHVLLRQTINDLTYYVTGKHVVTPVPSSTTTATTNNGGVPSTVNSNRHITDSPGASSVLTKKSVSQFASGIVTKLGIQQTHSADDASVGAGSVSMRSEEYKSASSMKHAESARNDIQRTLGGNTTTFAGGGSVSGRNPKKPPFQRPTNTSSSLIANGWIEQQRRSKLRVVWKEVLASLVEGRKPGEETTLWIQREYMSHTTNKLELEALHQIPIKLIRHIEYQDYTPDHRFLIKVHNMHEDFMFRCDRSDEAAQNWVSTIRSVIDIIKDQNLANKNCNGGANNNNKIPIRAALEQQERARQTFKASATSKSDDSKVPAQITSTTSQTNTPPPQQQHQQHQYPTAPKAPPQQPVASSTTTASGTASGTTANSTQPPPVKTASVPQQHMSITEMRAIAHGAGIQTHGLERGELELIVQQIANSLQTTQVGSGGTSPPPPSTAQNFAVPPTTSVPPRPVVVDPTLHRSTSTEEETTRQQQIEEAARRRKLAEDASRNRAAAEAQQAYARQQQEAKEKQFRAEEERKRLEAERVRRDEEEHQRRVAEQQAAEQRRRVEEQQRQQQEQWKQQQENWQKQQLEDEQRRRADEARMADEKRRQEEAYRAQHQQWQQQQQQTNHNGVPPNQWQPPPPHPAATAPFGAPPHPQQQQYGPGGTAQRPPPQHPGPPPNHNHGNSQVDQKYAKMATQVGDAGQQRSLQIIKHGILVEWALQPPAMQILRPIEVLITSVHVVFPPKYGVPGHDHFNKWSIVTLPEVQSGTQPDDEKLSKAVKKLRFVLHPDKLPREFTEEQIYMCRMIWDIVSDAFEDHKKREEELAWMR